MLEFVSAHGHEAGGCSVVHAILPLRDRKFRPRCVLLQSQGGGSPEANVTVPCDGSPVEVVQLVLAPQGVAEALADCLMFRPCSYRAGRPD